MKKRTTFSVVPWYFTIPSLIGLALILGPLLGLLYNIPWMGLHEIIDEEVVGATQLSLVTASILNPYLRCNWCPAGAHTLQST